MRRMPENTFDAQLAQGAPAPNAPNGAGGTRGTRARAPTGGAVPLPRPEDLHVCTDCAKLNARGFCSRFQRVLPYPTRPNVCRQFEPKEK